MAGAVIYIADPSDPSYLTVAVDLNELERPASGEAPSSVGWGVAGDGFEFEAQTSRSGEYLKQSPARGDLFVSYDDEHSVVRMGLYQEGESYADELERVRLLGRWLSRPGILVFDPNFDTDTQTFSEEGVIFDYEPSPVAALFRGGDRGLFEILEALHDLDGYPVEINVHPYPRAAVQPDPTVATRSNNNRVFVVNNPGSAVCEAIVRIAPAAVGTQLVQARLSRRSGLTAEQQAEYVAGFIISEAEDWSLVTGAGASIVADGPASGSDVVRHALSETAVMRPRMSLWLPNGAEGSFAGRYRVRAVIRPEAGFVWSMQLRWGNSDSDFPPNSNVVKEIDTTDMTTDMRMEIDLGEVEISEIASGLKLELWTDKDDTVGTDNLDFDVFVFEPVDELSVELYERGFRDELETDLWKGDDLVDATHVNLPSTNSSDDAGGVLPNLDGTSRVFGNSAVVGSGDHPNRTDEATGVPRTHGSGSDTGVALPLGQHRVTTRVMMQNNAQLRATLGELRVRRYHGGSWTDHKRKALKSEVDRQYITRNVSIVFEVTDDTDLWDFQVVFTSDRTPTTGNVLRKIFQRFVRHSEMRTIGSPYVLVHDSMHRETYVEDGNGDLDHHVSATALVTLEPGDNVFVLSFLTVPDSGSEEADADGDALGKVELTPSYEISVQPVVRNLPH